ncbi:hypothetical protein DSO57_1027392 [Entomophthora muscae]|uniref:Uncharacterized protein n=1 Tax=Entomophthora muscae TaxID=34485 RepID=A0ACC2TP95_9FUNG|nr:hypothetical protein DSO57_1027392 [Entomophthora muscae]
MAFFMGSDEEFEELLEQEAEEREWEVHSQVSCLSEQEALEDDGENPECTDLLNLDSLVADNIFEEERETHALGETVGFQSLVDSSDSDDSVQNEPERIDWDAIQNDFLEFKDSLAIATGIGAKNTKKKQGKKKGTVGRRKQEGPRKVRAPVLSAEIKGELGRINFLYANQEHEQAIALCQKVITSDPSIADPWITLAQIYEDLGSKEKALNFFLVAAFIAKFDGFFWKQAGDVANLGN